jgi:hypothetical protein
MRKKENKFDLMDALTLAGLGIFGVGMWLISPAISLSVVGAVIFLIGFMGSRS